MQTHTTIGADTLREVARSTRSPPASSTWRSTWPAATTSAGTAPATRTAWPATSIPLAARLLAVADVYDALRSRRMYKPGLSHTTAVMTMTEGSPGHFDPGAAGSVPQVRRPVRPHLPRVELTEANGPASAGRVGRAQDSAR